MSTKSKAVRSETPAVASLNAKVSAMNDTLERTESLVDIYLSATAQDLPELDRALARGDILKVASMAHRLKRAAADAGVEELSEAASRIESCYRKGAFEVLPFQVDAFCRAQRNYRPR